MLCNCPNQCDFFFLFLSAGWSSLNPFRQIQTLYKWQSSHLRGVFPIGKKKKIAFSKSSRMCCPVASLSPPLCLTNWLNYTSGGRRLQASGCCSVAARRRWGRGQWNFCTIKPGILPCASLTNAGRDHNKPLREGKLNTTSTIAQRKSRHGRGFPPCHLTRSKHKKKKTLIYHSDPRNTQSVFEFTLAMQWPAAAAASHWKLN